MDPDTEAHRNDVTVHSGGTESKAVFLYSVCDKRFTTNRNLSVHTMKHTGGQYSCTECAKCFTSLSALSRHKNVHSSKYKCTECGKCCGSSMSSHLSF